MVTKARPLGLWAVRWFVLIAVAVVSWFLGNPRSGAEDPAQPGPKRAGLKELQEERLETVRQIAKLTTEAFKAGTGSYEEVREATRLVLDAELEQCDTDKARVTVLEKFVDEAKKQEEHVARLTRAGLAPPRAGLKAKADRLQAEIALERMRVKAAGPTAVGPHDQPALAEKQVAIKRAAVKVAEAQKKIAVARLTSVRAQLAEAQAAESLAAKQAKRFEDLLKQHAVDSRLVDEHRAQWDSARARLTAAEGTVAGGEAQVALEQARVDLAQSELEAAELRVKHPRASQEQKR
jgi:multidrug resistance efflux pump